LLIENLSSKKSISEHELKDLQDIEIAYENNKEVIENLEGIVRERKKKDLQLNTCNTKLANCENILLELYKTHGYYEQKIENLEKEKARFKQLQNDYEAHDLYMKSMHPNGIAYDIIKKSLPALNNEISKMLSNVVEFQVFFETDDKRLDIYIQQPDRDPSPLEMASGAEKTVAAMAIRLAFTNISTLPKSQLFVLDEPGTALDEERMQGFIRILEITKSVFKTVILISHLDSLKDSVDSIINIENKDGFANVHA
jgi:DNA repair exonuclease SbcCD ATPase subunit